MDYKNKVKKKKGCFSGCLIYVFLPLLIIAATFFIVRFINNKRQEKLTFSLNNRFVYEEKLTAEDKLTNAFENGEISADTYVLQMAYSIFETSKLDSKYQSDNAIDFAPNIVELFCRYIDELSDETKEYIANKIMQTNIRIHPDASNNKDTLENSWFPFVIHAYAGKYDVTVLDKAYLSPNGRFLFWYTETGNSAVDEKTIQQLANEVESISEKIEQFLGVQWKYNSSLHNNDSYIESVLDICIESVLDRSDINWREILDAFPVYVYEPPNKDGALAWYCKDLVWYEKALVDFVAPFLKEELMDYWSVYSLPYITIKSSSAKDMEDLYFILAHELTHHFQQIYYDTKTHRTGGYTSETVANHTAASVIDITKTNTTINKYANAYIENSDFVLAKMENGSSRGYVEFVWAKSYTDVVENGNQYLKESLLQDDPYQFLCDKAGDSYLRVLEDLAVRNITKDYKQKTFFSTVFPKAKDDISIHMDTVESAFYANCFDYYYIDAKINSLYKTTIALENINDPKIFIKIICRKGDVYSLVDTLYCSKDSKITVADFTSGDYKKYDEVILAIGHCETKGWGGYKLFSRSETMIDFYETYTGINQINPWEVNGDCFTLYIDDFTTGTEKLAGFLSRNMDFADGDDENEKVIQELLNSFKSELETIQEAIKKFREVFDYEIIRIYSLQLENSELSEEEINTLLSGMMPKLSLNIIDTFYDGSHIKVYAGAQPFSDTEIIILLLASRPDGSVLYRIELEK